jgi:hypothetical protein
MAICINIVSLVDVSLLIFCARDIEFGIMIPVLYNHHNCYLFIMQISIKVV